jgi:hypothetical protein
MAQTKFEFEELQTPFEIIDEWNRDKDKTDTDLITFVKKLGIDDPDFLDRRKKEWTSKEKSKKTTGFFENIKDRYEDTMMKLHGAEEVTAPYLSEGDWFRKKHTAEMAPKSKGGFQTTRGASEAGLRESKLRDIAHKEFMKKKSEEVKEKEPELSMWQKIGKHFGENADKRDQLFTMLGSMGKELVKPIEPGKEAEGALLPTLSRGITKGEEEYATKQAAATKRAVDLASARQNINPLQYYTTAMKEARLMVPEGIDPDSQAGVAWIGNHLRSTGIPPQVVDLGATITEQQLLLTTAPEGDRAGIQKNISEMIIQLNVLVNQMMGSEGSTDTGTIDYTKLISGGF